MIQIPLFKLSTILWASCPQQRGVSRTGPCRVSVGNGEADQDLVGSLSAVVMSEAIKRAVYSADSAYGIKSAKDMKN